MTHLIKISQAHTHTSRRMYIQVSRTAIRNQYHVYISLSFAGSHCDIVTDGAAVLPLCSIRNRHVELIILLLSMSAICFIRCATFKGLFGPEQGGAAQLYFSL